LSQSPRTSCRTCSPPRSRALTCFVGALHALVWFNITACITALHALLNIKALHALHCFNITACFASTSLHATCCGACFNITACFALVQHHCMLDFLDWFASSLPHTSFPPPNITRQKPFKHKTKAFQY
jgi:hypothetical protein